MSATMIDATILTEEEVNKEFDSLASKIGSRFGEGFWSRHKNRSLIPSTANKQFNKIKKMINRMTDTEVYKLIATFVLISLTITAGVTLYVGVAILLMVIGVPALLAEIIGMAAMSIFVFFGSTKVFERYLFGI